jgi:hypothetical protein
MRVYVWFRLETETRSSKLCKINSIAIIIIQMHRFLQQGPTHKATNINSKDSTPHHTRPAGSLVASAPKQTTTSISFRLIQPHGMGKCARQANTGQHHPHLRAFILLQPHNGSSEQLDQSNDILPGARTRINIINNPSTLDLVETK